MGDRAWLKGFSGKVNRDEYRAMLKLLTERGVTSVKRDRIKNQRVLQMEKTMSMDEPFEVRISVINAAGTEKMLVSYKDLSRKALTEMEEVIGGALIQLGKSKVGK